MTASAPVATTRHPVVLVHGILGFVRQTVSRWTSFAYFQGVEERLAAAGVRAAFVALPAVAGVEERGRALADAAGRMGDGKVNLIAHSMGGLDARWYVGRLGGADRVASLVTISTPHQGTTVADLGIRRIGRGLAGFRLLYDLGIDASGFADLTRSACEERNARLEGLPQVPTFSYGGARPWWAIAAPMQYTFRVLQRTEGPNDGLVSTRSARWGEYLGTIEADHFAQTGWHWTPPGVERFDHGAFYLDVVRSLAERGS